MTYLLDANVFISAKNLHYGLDFCPAFWEWLALKNEEDVVFSIEQVGDEPLAGEDDLARWANARGSKFFRRLGADDFAAMATVSSWTQGQGYDPAAVSLFFQVADYYLIAGALAGGHVVVTHEVPSSSRRRIKIPNVCAGVGVKVMSPYAMLRAEHARFVLGDG